MSGRLTDVAIRRALTPAQDIVAPSDFSSSVHASISGVRQRPRRLWADLPGFGQLSGAGRALIVVLLMLGLLLGILLVGSLRQQTGPNGLLLLATGDQLRAIDVNSGTSAALLSTPTISQVTRSPDGKVVSFWTDHGDVDWLEVFRPDGGDRRRVAADLDMQGAGCIDQWSPDSAELAVTAVDAATAAVRILVVDLSGRARYITPPEARATCPIWSPDGTWLAFAQDVDGYRHVAIARPDGTGLRDVSGDLDGANASGANAWSSDGKFVYFDAKQIWEHSGQGRIYRADVVEGRSQLVFERDRVGDAPQLSPDGTWLSFNAAGAYGIIDLWIASPDGTGARILVENAVSAGWSTDGQFVLAESHSTADGPHGGLVVVRPDGSARQSILPFETVCLPYTCLEGLSWGQPRP